jgi:long-chain acyl-CoA synthetase
MSDPTTAGRVSLSESGFPTLWDLLEDHARTYPQQLAVVCEDVRLTYPELKARVTGLATGLASHGIGSGDCLLWCAQNCHRVLELLVAASRLGAFVCVANWRWSTDELHWVVGDANPSMIFWRGEDFPEDLQSAADEGSATQWLDLDSYEQLLRSPRREKALPMGRADQPVLLLYTSAFEGRPSGVLFDNVGIFIQGLSLAALRGIGHDDRYLCCGPLFHVATMMPMLATFHMGGTNIYLPRADPQAICEAVDQERCTGAFIVEPTISRIVELNQDGRYDLRSLRVPPGPAEWNTMVTVDTTSRGGYGLTEAGGVVTAGEVGGIGTHGRPLPNVLVRVIDEEGVTLPAEEVGEIAIKGPGMMVGYYRRLELNARRFADGWFRTGDLGRQEPDGSFSFVGTKRHFIKSGNENIYPAEVERCLRSHPAVADCAVIGVPDPIWNQRVKAVVVRAKSYDDTTAEDLIDHCRAHLASYKKPSEVAFVDALPYCGQAVDYDELDREHGGGGYPGRS